MTQSAIYKSLEGTTNTIRLLHASRPSLGKIEWTLEHYKLGSLPRRPYTALSYTWGDSSLREEIQINNTPFRVIFSVYAVLEAIRVDPNLSSQYAPDADSWWWIDGICINQDDPAERTAQVQLMGRIYRDSHRTVGWLGRGANGAGDEGIEFTQRAERAINDLNRLCEYGEDVFKGAEGAVALASASKLVDWPAVVEIWQRPWWSRAWTLQEFLIPSNFEFWCGRSHISRKRMNTAIELRENGGRNAANPHAISVGEWRRVKNRQRLIDWYSWKGDKLPLLALIAYGSDCKATDPRDRIYSVLTLAKRNHDEDLVKPSYDVNYTYEYAYTDLVVEYEARHKSLDIICFAHVFNRKGNQEDMTRESGMSKALPSWVPDWSANIWSYVVPVMASQTGNPHTGNFRPPFARRDQVGEAIPYAASGSRSTECIFSPDRTTLMCKGLTVSTISNNSRSEGQDQEPNLSATEASLVLETMSRSLVLGRKDRYLIDAYAQGEAYHDFRAFCHAASAKVVPLWDVFQAWFETYKDLQIRGTPLERLVELSLENPDFARRYKKKTAVDLTRKNKWLARFGDVLEPIGMDRKMVGLETGEFGVGPRRARVGNKICVLLGCSIPMTLRLVQGEEADKGGGVPRYEIIGEFYLDSIMNGEAVKVDSIQFTIFHLI